MDESRKQFEEWAVYAYGDGCLTLRPNIQKYESWVLESAWHAWQASRQYQSVIAYLTHQGSAVSPDDFEGGEAEMHETAKREEWAPLVKKGD
ncbi:hypothetical protein HH682_13600 [Rosenbergiella sp. S61]|uniref:Uncharacterized protein n=1 Tax=Rosenbergiella gaditana TaxID=2726987 RepID=A0ABS5SZ99_9GAMM|nr:hypothetical protein [Rosenbergiella gaditana]MBT0725434.1 hypothetical protein [Rosenbergiella gaditana]